MFFKKKRRRKRFNGLDKYIIFCFAMIIAYTITITVLKAFNQTDLSTEYITFCGVFGGEMLLCALIKRFKLKEGDKNNE